MTYSTYQKILDAERAAELAEKRLVALQAELMEEVMSCWSHRFKTCFGEVYGLMIEPGWMEIGWPLAYDRTGLHIVPTRVEEVKANLKSPEKGVAPKWVMVYGDKL